MVSVDDWSVSVGNWGNVLNDWDWVGNNWSCFVNDGIETIVVISGVVNLNNQIVSEYSRVNLVTFSSYSSDWTIRFNKGVLSLNDITVAFFSLWLDISGMWVLNSIVEWVFWVGNWFWNYNFVDWSMGIDCWSGMICWQWSIDWAGNCWCNEESGNNEQL